MAWMVLYTLHAAISIEIKHRESNDIIKNIIAICSHSQLAALKPVDNFC